MKWHYLLSGLLLTAMFLVAQTDDVELSASVSADRIGVEDILQLTVTFKGVGNPPEPDLSAIKQFDVIPGMVQRGTEFIMNNSGSTLLTRFVYQLRPKKKGKLTIPALSVEVDGRTVRSEAVTVEVIEGKVAAPQRRIVRRLPGFFDDPMDDFFSAQSVREPDLFVRAVPTKNKVYLGEAVIARIELFTRDRVEEKRMLRAASVPGFWVEWIDPQNVGKSRSEMVDGKSYTVIEIDRGLFIPQRTGIVEMTGFEYAFLVTPGTARSAFFTQRRQVVRKTKTISIEVLPLPDAARNLAVGQFSISMSARPLELDVNELLTLNVVIRGKGNIKSVQLPELPDIAGFKPFPAKIERRNWNQKGEMDAELKAEIPVSLNRVGGLEIPPLVLRFFNPLTGQIEESRSDELLVTVTGNRDEQTTMPEVAQDSVKRTGVDIDYLADGSIDDPRQGWMFGSLFNLLVALPFLLPMLLLGYRFILVPIRGHFTKGDMKTRLQGELKKIKEAESADILWALLDGFLAEALSIRPSQMTRGFLEQELGRIRISGQMISTLLDYRDKMQSLRFAGGVLPGTELIRMKNDLMMILSALIRGIR